MAHNESKLKKSKNDQGSSFALGFAYWSLVFGVNLYDLLGLCHLVPVNTLHINRPYIVSAAKFRSNRKKVSN